MPDMLEEIFELQKLLQGLMPIPTDNIEKFSIPEKQAFMNQMWIALVVELGETIQETQWKNPFAVKYGWKKTQSFNQEKMKKELVDCLHFFVNLCLASGMSAKELHDMYCLKNEVNKDRQEKNY